MVKALDPMQHLAEKRVYFQTQAPDNPPTISLTTLGQSEMSVPMLPNTSNTMTKMYQFFIAQQQSIYQHHEQQNLKLLNQLSTSYSDNKPLRALPGPKFNRQELEFLATQDQLSHYLGDWYQPIDSYHFKIRIPGPPFLLVDRVNGMKAEPDVKQCGTIWSETDASADKWFMTHHFMPAGLMLEAIQIKLLLASWLGLDFRTQGDHVYRLLGLELIYYGGLPKLGDTLCYTTKITGHAQYEDVFLMFFESSCWVNGQLKLQIKNGQGGFFTQHQLAKTKGGEWYPAKMVVDTSLPLDPPIIHCPFTSFSRAQIKNFAQGNAADCFGAGFERTRNHQQTPCIPGGDLLLIDEITHFDLKGGPCKRGYMRAVKYIAPDDWFFKGHFKNDPCMPGSLMLEGCIQLMSCYLTALGFTLDKDGWHFEPIPSRIYRGRCRGQVTPKSQQLAYELFVHSIVARPKPSIIADVICSVDHIQAFHAQFGLQLVKA